MIRVPAQRDVTDRSRFRSRIIAGLLIGVAALVVGAWKLKTSRELLARRQHRAAQSSAASVHYEDRLFGRVMLKDVTVDRSRSGYLVHAGEVSIGPKRWRAVTLSTDRPKAALTIGIGEQVASSAQIKLRYVPTSGIASEWFLDLASQPLAPLIRRIGLDPGMAFNASRMLGSISLIVPNDPELNIRGTLSLLVDGCPKPTWPESKALIGETCSLWARIEPAADRSVWELPNVEVTLPLFTLSGTGRITLGEHPRFSIDVSGVRNCAQLRAHLPPSNYLELVKSHVEVSAANAAGKRPPDPAAESAELRIQMDLDDSPQGRRNVAWHLAPGCGLEELSQGTFAELALSHARASVPLRHKKQELLVREVGRYAH
jgi:hypothetical protein